MAKYKRFQCDTCHREVDVDNDHRHVFLTKCTITNGCLGTLRFKEDRNSKENFIKKLNPQQLYVGDRISNVEDNIVSLSSSTGTDVYLAVRRESSEPPQSSSVSLYFNELKNKNQEFKEFQFNMMVPFSAVSGKDSSVDQRVLAFSENDEIFVYVNGELTPADNYVAARNIIMFNELVTYDTFKSSSVFVRVVIQNKIPENQKTLVFSRNVQNLANGAWENVKEFTQGEDVYDIYVCRNMSSVSLNSKLIFTGAKIDNVDADISRFLILIATAPYTLLDRVLTKCVKLETLTTYKNFMQYTVMSKKNMVVADTSSTSSVFPPFMVSSVFSEVYESKLNFSSTSTDSDYNNNVPNINEFILGPV